VNGTIDLRSKIFTLIVSTAGCGVLGYSIYRLGQEPLRLDWFLALAFMVLASWRAEIWIPGVRSKISWIQVETGSAITWKYPSCILQGDESVGSSTRWRW